MVSPFAQAMTQRWSVGMPQLLTLVPLAKILSSTSRLVANGNSTIYSLEQPWNAFDNSLLLSNVFFFGNETHFKLEQFLNALAPMNPSTLANTAISNLSSCEDVSSSS